MYKSIIESLIDAGSVFYKKKKPYKVIPGWHEYCSEAHMEAREAFLTWQSCNKPRFGPIYENVSKYRAQFKSALRFCRSQENKARADALLRSFFRKTPKASGRR